MNDQSYKQSKRRGIVITLAIFAGLLLLVGVFKLGQLSRDNDSPEPLASLSPTPTPTPEVFNTIDPLPVELYSDCGAVWDELERPITRDDEGFPESAPNKFDLDADGVGCEDNPNTTDVDESEIDWESIWIRTKENGQDFSDYVNPKLKSFWESHGDPAVESLKSELEKLF